MHGWLLDLVRCPACGGRLAASLESQRLAAGLLVCKRCEAAAPVLGGVPILVDDPAGYCATYREPIAAALAEVGAARKRSLEVLDVFARSARRAEPGRFSDDWTHAEREGVAVEVAPLPGEAAALLARLSWLASTGGPSDAVLELLGTPRGAVLELGAGAGLASPALAKRCDSLVVADLSLRAALLARARAGSRVAALVLDAESLSALAPGAFAGIVAQNLVDLLDAPLDFLDGASRALSARGRLLVSTPDPSLGAPLGRGDERALESLLSEVGMEVAESREGIPWARVHGPRHLEAYLVRVLSARRSRARRSASRR